MTDDTNSRRHLPVSEGCFVCGISNPAGLSLRFYVEEGNVMARWRPKAHHCGYENVVHGGVVAAALDESMAWAAARVVGRMCVTGDLHVRYLSRVPGDIEIVVCAEVEKAGRRLVHVNATLRSGDGVEFADARGRFVPISAEETLATDDEMLYREGDERPFDPLRAESDTTA
ncbi:MAG: hypothetical protein GWP08_20820 [Nitrospiraceae bacterium]|nr:hypothetical protein [Nitrospiraceae bacterium]